MCNTPVCNSFLGLTCKQWKFLLFAVVWKVIHRAPWKSPLVWRLPLLPGEKAGKVCPRASMWGDHHSPCHVYSQHSLTSWPKCQSCWLQWVSWAFGNLCQGLLIRSISNAQLPAFDYCSLRDSINISSSCIWPYNEIKGILHSMWLYIDTVDSCFNYIILCYS